MLSRLRARSMFRKSNFALFLSLYADWQNSSNDKVIWSLYQLGMYSEVGRRFHSGVELKNAHKLIAIIASLSACGETERVRELICQFERHYSSEMMILVEKLGPFDYGTALQLAKKYDLQSLFVVALLEKNNEFFLAQQMLDALSYEKDIYTVDWLIVQANLEQNMVDKLRWFNEIFKFYNMPTIFFKDPQNPNFNVNNLEAESNTVSSPVSGGLVSVIMTAFNASSYMQSAIESLLMQTYRHFELIIVDDCSEDDTWEIIKNYAATDNRIRPIKQTVNAGTYLAKNRALLEARGDFVMCHDADDWSHPQRLEIQLRPLLENNAIIATSSNWVRLTDEGRFVSRSVYPLSRLNPSSMLFRKEVVMEKVGFWDNVRTGADSEFNQRLKLAFGKEKVKKINLPLAIGSFHEKSLMNSPETGFVDQRIPVDRQMYWESWMHWHIDVLRNKGSFYLPMISSYAERKFEAPEKILPNESVLKEVAQSIQH